MRKFTREEVLAKINALPTKKSIKKKYNINDYKCLVWDNGNRLYVDVLKNNIKIFSSFPGSPLMDNSKESVEEVLFDEGLI